MNQISRKQQWRLFKFLVATLAIGYLVYEIVFQRDISKLMYTYTSSVVDKPFWLILVLVLMPVNWMLETYKWQQLLRQHVQMKFKDALRGVLMGVSVGLFTPNGVGEFGGRMLVVSRKMRQYAASTSIVSSLSQLAITITIGGACLMFYISDYLAPEKRIIAYLVACGTVVIGYFAYFQLPRITTLLFRRIKWFNRYNRFVKSLESVSKKTLLNAYLVSLMRYLVFCFQLVVVIYLVSDWEHVFKLEFAALIPVNYYIQTIIPTIALSEIGVRSFVLGMLFEPHLLPVDLIAASFLIWVVNLIIPGLVGLFVFLRFNANKI